jgi:nucleoside-diphosphate-sugar epimerase
MKVLLAGGAGFIGSHLAEELVSRGNDVVVLDNFSSGLEKNIESIKRKINVLRQDVNSFSTNERYDFVLNFASRASRTEWERDPVGVALTNSVGSINLIKVALACGAIYVFASSSEIYGNASVIPTPEHYFGSVSTTGSRSPYDEGKRFGEAIVKAYERQFGLRGIILRLFNTYGERMRGDDTYGRVVDRFINQALKNAPITVYGDGSQTRSFTYVSDTVKGIVLAVERGREGEVYNLGNNRELKILQLAEKIRDVTKSSSEIVFRPLPEGDPKRRAADISKMKGLGWYPSISIEVGIQKMAEFYKEEVRK